MIQIQYDDRKRKQKYQNKFIESSNNWNDNVTNQIKDIFNFEEQSNRDMIGNESDKNASIKTQKQSRLGIQDLQKIKVWF